MSIKGGGAKIFWVVLGYSLLVFPLARMKIYLLAILYDQTGPINSRGRNQLH